MAQTNALNINTVFKSPCEPQDSRIKALIDILDNVNCEKMLVSCFVAGRVNDLQPSDNPITAQMEILAEHCVSRFGNQEPKFRTDEKIESCIDALDSILSARTISILTKSNGEKPVPELTRIAAINNANVRGSAYFNQLENKILGIQGKLDSWYQKNLGISASRLFEIIKKIVEKSAVNFEKLRTAATQEDGKQVELTTFHDLIFEYIPVRLTSFVSKEEIPPLKDLLLFSKEAQSIGKKAQDHPILVLPDNRVIISEGTHALDCLWETLDNAIKKDQRTYGERYQKAKANWLEKVGVEYLKRIFPTSDVYETLDYRVTGKEKGKDTGELDIAVQWGSFVLLIEAKAKDYPPLAKQGNPVKLRTALKKNVEDAFIQSLRAENEIRSNQSVTFIERATKRKLVFSNKDVHKIYPISLSLHHLMGISTRIHQARDLGLFNSGSFPLSICATDLDLITKCDNGPEVFLHYIEQRLDIMNGREEEWLGDEYDLFSAYLDTRLIKKNIEIRSGASDFSMLSFSGYSDMFDRLEIYEAGGNIERPDTSIRLPKQAKNIIRALCARESTYSRAIAFSLLGLDDTLLLYMAKAIEEAGTKDFPISQNRSVILASEDTVVTLLFLSSRTSKEQVEGKTMLRCSLEKYRRERNKGVAIAIMPGKPQRSYEFAMIEESEWKEEPELEKLAAEHAPVPKQGSKLPKRNEKCFCGSGKKFKKCCLRRIEEAKRPKKSNEPQKIVAFNVARKLAPAN